MVKKNILVEICFIVFATFILLFFSYKPIYDNFQKAPPSLYYYGSIDYPLDLTGNLAVVQEGYLGHWMRIPKATSTIEGRATFLKIEYILIGQAARLFHTDPIFMYFLTRFVISFVFLIVLYLVIRNVFQKRIERFVAFIFCLFATGIINPYEVWGIMNQLPGDARVFQRLTTATHHYLLSSLFMVLSLFYLAKAIDSFKFKPLLLAGIFGFISTLTYPSSMFLVIISLPVYLGLKVIRFILLSEPIHLLKKEIFFLVFYVFISLMPFLYFRYTTQFWDFSALSKTEHIVPFDINPVTYVQVVGLIYMISFFAYISILRKDKTLFLLFIPWIIVHPLSIFVFSKLLGINSLRFFLTPYYIVFSLLATYAIFTAAKYIGKVGVFIIVVIVLASGFYSYRDSFAYHKVCFCLIPSVYDYGYPKKEVMDTIFWLKNNTKEGDIVLSGFYAGTLIPAFSGNYVYTSWWHFLMSPPNINSTILSINRFYSLGMKETEAEEFLRKNRISYVYFGEAERQQVSDHGDLSYSFLRKVYRNNQTILYAVQ